MSSFGQEVLIHPKAAKLSPGLTDYRMEPYIVAWLGTQAARTSPFREDNVQPHWTDVLRLYRNGESQIRFLVYGMENVPGSDFIAEGFYPFTSYSGDAFDDWIQLTHNGRAVGELNINVYKTVAGTQGYPPESYVRGYQSPGGRMEPGGYPQPYPQPYPGPVMQPYPGQAPQFYPGPVPQAYPGQLPQPYLNQPPQIYPVQVPQYAVQMPQPYSGQMPPYGGQVPQFAVSQSYPGQIPQSYPAPQQHTGQVPQFYPGQSPQPYSGQVPQAYPGQVPHPSGEQVSPMLQKRSLTVHPSTSCCGGETLLFSYKRRGQDWREICTIGQAQSPINIENSTEVSSVVQTVHPDSSNYRPLLLTYEPSPMITCVRGSGNYIVKDCISGSFTGVPIGGTQPQQFNLVNIHFHCPSEHQINGHTFHLEMHIVHQDAAESHAVIAVLFEEAKEESHLLKAAIQGTHLDLDHEVGKVIDDFYFYSGSLTTPPCTEPVHWFIKRQPLKATRHQLRFFREMWPDNEEFAGGNGNNRELQPRNGRKVYRFQTKT